MCIGIPMQITAIEPGHALCSGRGVHRRVNTALVGALALGDWVLIFIDSVQEHISFERATEINATLDLMQAAMHGESAGMAVGFSLPSAMSATELKTLFGATL
jgi:hydrogenase expression/formation protein HypC